MVMRKRGFIIFICVVLIFTVCSFIIYKLMDSRERDPVVWAINTNSPEDLKSALESGADVNKMTQADITGEGFWDKNPLRIAIELNSEKCCEILIEYGADVNYIDGEGDSLLMCAAGKCDYDKVKLLLTSGADPYYVNEEGVSIMAYAITAPYAGDAYDNNEAIAIVDLLFEEGIEINEEDVINHLSEIVHAPIKTLKFTKQIYHKYLLANRSALADMKTLCCIYAGDTNRIITYMMNNEKVDFYIIAACVAEDNIEVLKYYYENGGSLDITEECGYEQTLLMIAAAFNSTKCIEFILDHGADKNVKSDEWADDEGARTALEYAERYGNDEAIELLK